MSTYTPKDWNKEPITPTALDSMEQGIASAHTEIDTKVAKAGDALTGPFSQDQAAPGAGTQPYWTFQHGGTNALRFALDTSGNLVLERWDGAAWQTFATFPKAGGVATGLSADQTDGIHLRVTGSLLEFSSDGNTWTQAGIPEGKVFFYSMVG